jgi:hypothetical protein
VTRGRALHLAAFPISNELTIPESGSRRLPKMGIHSPAPPPSAAGYRGYANGLR